MHHPFRSLSWSLIAVALLCGTTVAVAADSRPTIKDKTAGSERRSGLLNFYADADKGQLWLELPAPAGPEGEIGSYLYIEGLLTGLGSNPVGLDRGQIGETRLVRFRRVGGKVLLEQPNLNFRARTEDAAEARAGRESFATSVLWAADIAAQDKDGHLLVDFAPFLLRDAHDAIGALKAAGQGAFTLDSARSAVDVPNCLAFPDNVEFESLLTFTSSDPGREVRATAPTPQAVTLVQHQSFVRLPPAGYQPRAYDPRTGSFAIGFRDTAAPLTVDPDVRFLVRHRLQKTDPAAARSTVTEPIVYYIDPGAPEPVRTALFEGTKWWARAFEEAGFVDAFRVELLPADAHPLDVRYNVVQWVHRATRGWSYGGGVVDPRTGEMIKGHVTLGSLRVRQDRMIFEGLLGTEKTGSGAADDPVQLALWRIRQLAAHEVGHTLGLAHNFAASTYGRGSVMDYPAPLVGVTADGRLDVSDVYTSAVGDWDLHAIRYAYAEFPAGTDEAAELERMVRAGHQRGLVYLTDPDARPAGAAQPLAALWDNGADPVAALAETLKVRSIAVGRFGEGNLTAGTPLGLLEEVLGPMYFYHRYQLEAAQKMLGGVEYRHALRGDGQPPPRAVPAERQRAALAGILAALDGEVLDVPDRVLDLLLPRPPEWGASRERFSGAAGPAFDMAAAAASAAALAIDGLIQPERAARLVQQHARDPKQVSFEDVLKALEERVFAPAPAGRRTELARAAREVLVARLVEVAENRDAAPAVRARVEAQLERLRRRLSGAPERWHEAFLAAEIARHQARERTEGERPRAAPAPPPGPPIGSAAFAYQDCEFGG